MKQAIFWQRQHRYFLSLLLLLFILIGFLAVRYDQRLDLTQDKRHALSDTSKTIIEKLDPKTPISVTAFVRGNPQVKQLILRVLAPYQSLLNLELKFKHIDSEIDLVKQYNISREGELLLSANGQTVLADALDETAITRAIYLLFHQHHYQVVWLSGHGERAFEPDFSRLQQQLSQQMQWVTLIADETETAFSVPDNTDLLVLAAPKKPYSAQIASAIIHYVENGGKLLWFAEPDSARQPLLDHYLGINWQTGELLSHAARRYRLADAGFSLISKPETTPDLPLAFEQLWQSWSYALVFPKARALTDEMSQAMRQNTWQFYPLLYGDKDSMRKEEETISSAPSPLVAAILKDVRPSQLPDNQGLAVLIGDMDFMSNQYLGLLDNTTFSEALWQQLLTPDAYWIRIEKPLPAPVTIDEKQLAFWALTLIIGLPLFLILFGFYISRRLIR